MGAGVRFRSVADMPKGVQAAAAAALAAQAAPCHPTFFPETEKKVLGPNKYGAVPTYVDGIRFDSKREARLYESLKARQATGELLFFLRQVPIHLAGGTKLVVDFLLFYADGRFEFLDAKGKETPVFKVKRREVEAAYPIRIITV